MKKILFTFLTLLLFCFCNLSNAQKVNGVKMPKGFVYIPQGSFVFEKDTVSVNGFYICKTEISNQDYREFLYDLQRQSKIKELNIAKVDSNKWIQKNAYNDPYAKYYANHPAYNKYPVVNITYEAALLYCEWLSVKLSELNKGKYEIKVRLPLRTEWVYAASCGGKYNPYAWGGPYVRNSKGYYLCNFKNVGEENIRFNKDKKNIEIVTGTYTIADGADITAPVTSFFPNKFGLYNVNGNVAEMVNEKGLAVGGSWKSYGYEIRNESVENYSGADTHIGFRPVVTVVEKKK